MNAKNASCSNWACQLCGLWTNSFLSGKQAQFFSGTQKCYLVLQNIKTESFRFVFMQKTFMESFDNVRVYKEYSGALQQC